MSEKKNANAREQLSKLEKTVKKILRKSLKNNTLDYTVQISISSLEPGNVKYSAFISSPNKDVQPIIFSYDNFEMLEAALLEAEKQYNPTTVEVAFHESRINTYKSKIEQHEERKKQLEDPEYKEEDDIPMEEVGVGE
jgi:hypothetical protein